MSLSGEDRGRLRGELELWIAEYRSKPTQELEDELGLRVATLPAAERDQVPALLLEIVAAERG
ncbi:MAG TPA: hypothetical protein VHA54_11855 [Solirubrobacterales bacterium]|nr:hypothetical protein [Solirubrobacterales bacterium]